MKIKPLSILGACLALSGCSSLKNIPGVEFGSWTHDGNYGVFTTHVEASGATKDAEGKIHLKSYSGHLKVAGGYGPSDTITDLVIDPNKQAPVVNVIPDTKPAPVAP